MAVVEIEGLQINPDQVIAVIPYAPGRAAQRLEDRQSTMYVRAGQSYFTWHLRGLPSEIAYAINTAPDPSQDRHASFPE